MLACFCFASFESLSTFNIFLKHDYIKNWWEIFYLKNTLYQSNEWWRVYANWEHVYLICVLLN